MKNKIYILCTFFLCFVFAFWGCNEELFGPETEDFKVKSFISNIKCYDAIAVYNENIIPANSASSEKPHVSVQSWVIKGEDILMNITVPDNAEEIYFGAVNSQEEYLGLSFEDQNKGTAAGYYRLRLSEVENPDSERNGYANYLVVLSSNRDIQLNKFDLIVSCKTSAGISNTAAIPLDVISIAPFQQTLRVGFRPLEEYTYSISINTPEGNQIIYSYDKDSGIETYNNSQSPHSGISYEQSLDIKWIDLDPQFGNYSMTATINIDLDDGSQYIYLIIIIVAEGKIDQLNVDADIQQTGGNMAVGTVNIYFSYFSQYTYYYEVPGFVPVIKQPPGNTCWATVSTMLMSWRNNQSYSIERAMAIAGTIWLNKFNNREGLLGSEKNQFLNDIGLVGEPNMTYTVEGFYTLLLDHGPLWVTTNESSTTWAIHARIVTGLHGDGTPENTMLHIIDPLTGSEDIESYIDFVRKFESVASSPFQGLQVVHY